MIRRSLIAAVTAVSLVAAPLTGSVFAGETEFEGAEEIATGIADGAGDIVDDMQDAVSEPFGETIYIAFEDGYKKLLADVLGMEDMSWLNSIQFDFSSAQNDTLDFNGVFCMNDEELYHLFASFNPDDQMLYLQIPELKDQPAALSVSALASQNQAVSLDGMGLSQEEIQELTTQAIDFLSSVPAEKWEEELGTYLGIFASRVQQESGSTTVTAGDLSVEASTITFKFDDKAVAEALPELLTAVSKDELVKSLFESDFGASLVAKISESAGQEMSAADLYEQLSSSLGEMAVTGDFSSVPGGAFTMAVDENGNPVQFELDMVMDDVTVELGKLSFIGEGTKNACEFELGSTIASMLGAEGNGLTGFTASGEITDTTLNEKVSVLLDGAELLTADCVDFDLEQLSEGFAVGKINVNFMGTEFSFDMSVTDEGWQAVVISVNGELFMTELVAVFTGEDVTVVSVDPEGAAEVSDEESLSAYLQDADINGMLELLKGAGVPAELVDALTGAAAEDTAA